MHGDQPQSVIDLEDVGVRLLIDTLSDIVGRHAVMMAFQRHIAVLHYRHGLSFLQLVSQFSKRAQIVPLDLVEQL